jgi:hypothetical protein
MIRKFFYEVKIFIFEIFNLRLRKDMCYVCGKRIGINDGKPICLIYGNVDPSAGNYCLEFKKRRNYGKA